MNSNNKNDQASTLRKMTGNGQDYSDSSCNNAAFTRVISVTSGKGGVGKTSIVSNLAFLLSEWGKKVLVLDADMGLANIDIMLGLTPEYTLEHVLNGEKSLNDVIISGPGGMKIIPASSGVQELTELTQEQKLNLLSEFGSLENEVDFFFIDTGAGISSNVMFFNVAAQERVVVVTPEPTSITDAYAIMKVMTKKHAITHFTLIANQTQNEKEANELFDNISSVADRFLNVSIELLGYLVKDNHISLAVRNQKLVTVLYPKAKSSLCYLKLAKNLLESKPPSESGPGGNIGFFWNNLLESNT